MYWSSNPKKQGVPSVTANVPSVTFSDNYQYYRPSIQIRLCHAFIHSLGYSGYRGSGTFYRIAKYDFVLKI